MALGSSNSGQAVEGAGHDAVPTEDSNGEPSQSSPPPVGDIRLWQDVGAGIDRSQTVVWKAAVESLEKALHYLYTSPDARHFVEMYMRPVISILLDQQPSKIGSMEKDCVEGSLRRAVTIVAKDLESKKSESSSICSTLETLSMVFNRKKTYYKGSKPNWNVTLNGAPEVRVRMIHKFRAIGGFESLAMYLGNRAHTNPEQFPSSDVLHLLLGAIADILPMNFSDANNKGDTGSKSVEDTIVRLSEAVMVFMDRTSEEALKRQANDTLSRIRYDLQLIFDKLAPTRRKDTFRFYEFWRKLTLKLIKSQSLPLRLFGWEQVGELIEASGEMRPPPKYFIVEGAGRNFVNGRYVYAGPMDDDGYARIGGEASYVLTIPQNVSEKEGGGKTLTLFRCTMRSQQKWWFLSEADEDQPGTDKDEDYYQHKSKSQDESVPPASGWTTCRNAGVDPPPRLRGSGLMVPLGEEFNTLEHQLAKWAIENGIIELVLGDSVHREVVARSQPLIKFLASMCERDEAPVEITGANAVPNAFCLQAAHLLLAWKTCTSKADAAVSAEIYHLLVSILPSLPDNLATKLLSAIQISLHDGAKSSKHDLLPEVAEFCSALSATAPRDVEGGSKANANSPAGQLLSDAVRAEVLNLMWEVLTHPEASSLKPYDRLKSYVTHELGNEPFGRRHRDTFLKSCTETLSSNAENRTGAIVDESFALQMAKLTRFVLEACPREHSVHLVTVNHAALPNLLFEELSAYMTRRESVSSSPTMRKANSFAETNHVSALVERLSVLRYAYGLTDEAEMSSSQLDHLWEICLRPSDREALMVFLANASNGDSNGGSAVGSGLHVDDTGACIQNQPYPSPSMRREPLRAAFSHDVRLYAFQNLICSNDMDWEMLGESAYRSFQAMFGNLRHDDSFSPSTGGPDIDALWRICLTSGNSDVASRAMKDLLDVYIKVSPRNASTNQTFSSKSSWSNAVSNSGAENGMSSSGDQSMTDNEASFVRRIFECLVQVRKGLEANDPTSERSAERCLRIINAAIGQGNSGNGAASATSSAMIVSLPSMTSVTKAADAVRLVPHGMRGQSCYRTISVLAKRTSQQNHVAAAPAGTVPPLPAVRDESGNFVVPPIHAVPVSTQVKLPSVVRFSLDVHPLETLASVKAKVASFCDHPIARVKALSVNGRQISAASRSPTNADGSQLSLNVVPDASTVAQLGVTEGCEVVFLLAGHPLPANSSPGKKTTSRKNAGLDIFKIFEADDVEGSHEHFFDTLLAVLEALPVRRQDNPGDVSQGKLVNTSKLVWDLLLAMPSNPRVVERVKALQHHGDGTEELQGVDGDKMVVDSPGCEEEWSALLDGNCFHRSVYTMQLVDSFLQPAPEILCSLPESAASSLQMEMVADASLFRKGFIGTGGFEAVLRLFTEGSNNTQRTKKVHRNRMGDAVALRVLRCCFLGNGGKSAQGEKGFQLDDAGQKLLSSLSEPKSLLFSLTEVVVADVGVSDSAILDSLFLLQLLLTSKPALTDLFITLPDGMAERFVTSLLLRESKGLLTPASVSASTRVRRSTLDLVLKCLSHCSLPWLIDALKVVDVTSESTDQFFDVVLKLVEGGVGDVSISANGVTVSQQDPSQLRKLGTAICEKLSAHPRPTSETATVDGSTGVLCGCLKLLRALIETGGGIVVTDGSKILSNATGSTPWSKLIGESKSSGGMFEIISCHWRTGSGLKSEDAALIDLMGSIFDDFLSSAGALSSSAICCDKESRKLGFDVVTAAARSCEGGDGYLAIVTRVRDIISAAAPSLRHKWGLNGATDDGSVRPLNATSKYSGLRNQGCTCYMNSLLQQLFMMPDLRKSICSAPMPSCLRSSGSGVVTKGSDLIGKKISLQWESGISYDAIVQKFDSASGMHTIRYCPLSIATPGTQDGSGVNIGHHHSHHQPQFRPEDVASLPEEFPDEFFLIEGRPGKETGVFEILPGAAGEMGDDTATAGESSRESRTKKAACNIEETEEQASSRKLLEEVQRTFVHLEEGSRGRCFDPRSLVEASGCLKLEFDVWQQNDASEYAMKLLDRLEVALKRWAPDNCRFMANTFGLKQTKQKECKECGLKTNREENHMTIDCQIRGKSDIHEALAAVCEVEYMEGDNKITCDRCEKKTDSVLRTAISALPDMLVLSLKRFDLDYTTFETVKLNSRCAFGQTLNMKRYTLDGMEATEKAKKASNNMDKNSATNVEDAIVDSTEMETDVVDNPLESLPDEDYEYKLAGVLVHAGVAQGGHYYSYIRDRRPTEGESGDKWYRFDDEDVAPFDPSAIEVECFGGKVKKETKWPSGQVHTVESEQFANALMLFYEKVKPVDRSDDQQDEDRDCPMEEQDVNVGSKWEMTTGYDVFQPDVRRSNTTHSWHTFLFDSEFQLFLKGLLCLCMIPALPENNGDEMEVSTPSPLSASPVNETSESWRLEIVRMSVAYVFDILLHSADNDVFADWVNKLTVALKDEESASMWLTHELARRTHEVSKNWLRTYGFDCAESTSRSAAMNIILGAIENCVRHPRERSTLQEWTEAWKSQWEAYQRPISGKRQNVGVLPTQLEGTWKAHENVAGFEKGTASSIGVLISAIASFLEHAPRYWRNSSGLPSFLSSVATIPGETEGEAIRKALVAAQIPARLICLAIRDRSPLFLRAAFPGASMSLDLAEVLVRGETPASSHMMTMPGGMSGGGAVPNASPNIPSAGDYENLMESLGCIIGVQGVKRAPLTVESEGSKGRTIGLSPAAREALAVIFHEVKSPSAGGMGHHEIQRYMARCGIDVKYVHAQKISNILNKYPTISGRDGNKESRYLSLEGFLSYYRDTAQSKEVQVRSDLHTFGFRLDLSRRPEELRFIASSSGSRRSMDLYESIANDVALLSKDKQPQHLGSFAEMGLDSFHLHAHNLVYSDKMAPYILATSAYGRDSNRLLVEALQILSRAPTSGAGRGESCSSCLLVFRILLAIPDERQQERIETVMQSTEKASPYAEAGVGLLVASRELSVTRTSQQQYSPDFHFPLAIERYIEIVRALFLLQAVAQWMQEHREMWSWMEQWGQHSRGDNSGRRDGAGQPPTGPIALHYSDSDVNTGMGNDSEDEDEDFRYDNIKVNACSKVIVQNAGVDAVNGTYVHSGSVDGVGKYTKEGTWDGRQEGFSLYRCQLNDHTRKWFISIVPRNTLPGTNKDKDFYWAAGGDDPAYTESPPETGWCVAKDYGRNPAPIVNLIQVPENLEDEDDGADANGPIWNDDDDVVDDESGREANIL